MHRLQALRSFVYVCEARLIFASAESVCRLGRSVRPRKQMSYKKDCCRMTAHMVEIFVRSDRDNLQFSFQARTKSNKMLPF
jgi:hypothetical protein